MIANVSKSMHRKLLLPASSRPLAIVLPRRQEAPYPPILNANELEAGGSITIKGEGAPIRLTAFDQEHGNIRALGFRIGNLAYSCDLSDIPKSSYEAFVRT